MTNLKADADAIKAIPPTPAAAEARATEATEGGVNAALVELLHDLLERALNIAHSLSLPPPEPKDGAAPSPETLGRFGHHPDPAIDFCTEVDVIVGMIADLRAGVGDAKTIEDRIFTAKMFRVGGDEHAVRAMRRLREIGPAAPAAPFPDLTALEELAGRLEAYADGDEPRMRNLPHTTAHDYATALRSILKAQPNPGPSADGGKGA